MEHEVEPAGDVVEMPRILGDDVNTLVANEVGDVLEGARQQVVDDDHLDAVTQQAIGQVRSDETGTACDERASWQQESSILGAGAISRPEGP